MREEVIRAGSLIPVIDQQLGPGPNLLRFRPSEPNKLELKLARQEALDPESSANTFEPMARPGLLKGLRGLWHRAEHSRA